MTRTATYGDMDVSVTLDRGPQWLRRLVEAIGLHLVTHHLDRHPSSRHACGIDDSPEDPDHV